MTGLQRFVPGAGIWLLLASGCSGDGCAVPPIPGGFSPEARVANAVQVRISDTGLAALTQDPEALITGFLGQDTLAFELPPSCTGNPQICCDANGNPITPCGPIDIDLQAQAGDAPRFELDPVSGQSRMDVVVRARVQTQSALAVAYKLPIVPTVRCNAMLSSTAGNTDDLVLSAPVSFAQDAVAGTTRVEVGAVALDQLETADISLSGNLACDFANVLVGLFRGQIVSAVEDAVAGALTQQVCKPCPSGDVRECGPFASACQDGVCMAQGAADSGQCLQELGLSGRLPAGLLLGALAQGSAGGLDFYGVAGGYATTDDGGMSVGVLGGVVPAGTERDRCGPSAPPPPAVDIPVAPSFGQNVHPETGAPFDVAIGVHQHELDLLAWSAYESGLLCATLDHRTVELLTSNTFALVMPSLLDLVQGAKAAPMALGLRPQAPPIIRLGRGIVADTPGGGRTLVEPLLDVTLPGLEVDLFALIDDQVIRLMTVRADVHLPVGLDVGADGRIVPILGNLDDAFGPLEVLHSQALAESPAELAVRMGPVLDLALPTLVRGLGSLEVPGFGNLRLVLEPGSFTSAEENRFLAVFGRFQVSQPQALARAMPRIDTTAAITAVRVPEAAAFAPSGRFADAQRPAVELALGGGYEGGGLGGEHAELPAAKLEWSVRVDGGAWSPYGQSPRLTVSRPSFWLPGRHTIEVRARVAGNAATTDPTPVVLEAIIEPARSEADTTVGGSGCSIGGAGSARGSAAGMLLLMAGALVLGCRQRRSGGKGAVLAVVLGLGVAGSGGCGGSESAPLVPCPNGVGRHASIAAADDRIVVAAHERSYGDLMLMDVAQDGTIRGCRLVDGVPEDAPATEDPNGYRGGITEPGENVGYWTSVVLAERRARMSYHDVTNGHLRYAAEGDGGFEVHVIDTGDGGAAGHYSSLALDADGVPAVAYMVVGTDARSAGSKVAQLRFARANRADPRDSGDWSITVIDEVGISCAGLCGDGQVCVGMDQGGRLEERCVTESAGCAAECGDGACVGGVCMPVVPEPAVHDLPPGTGLFADLRYLPDGRPIIVYYDRVAGDLVMRVGGDSWARVALDAAADTDTGMWASTVVDAGGTVHVAYQDALGDRLLYTTWTNGLHGPIEVVDDGVRPDDRPHPVGAGAALFLDASGAPAVAYQDGLVSDLVLARRAGPGGAWTRSILAAGPQLYGFFTDVATLAERAWIVSYHYDRSGQALGQVMVTSTP